MLVSVLMSGLQKVETRCFAEKHRYCTLDEMAPDISSFRWAKVQVQAPMRASLGHYDLQLVLVGSQYCLAAFPTRFGEQFKAIWRDAHGQEYGFPYPWRTIPKPCEGPHRPKLLVE